MRGREGEGNGVCWARLFVLKMCGREIVGCE